jgi:hypothetical protein
MVLIKEPIENSNEKSDEIIPIFYKKFHKTTGEGLETFYKLSHLRLLGLI